MASVDWGSLYRDVCDSGVRKRLIEPFAYSASAWLKWFKKYSEDRDSSSIRAMSILSYPVTRSGQFLRFFFDRRAYFLICH